MSQLRVRLSPPGQQDRDRAALPEARGRRRPSNPPVISPPADLRRNDREAFPRERRLQFPREAGPVQDGDALAVERHGTLSIPEIRKKSFKTSCASESRATM